MRLLALLFLVVSTPALAGDYTPWLAQTQTPTTEKRWYCCRHCTKGEQPCDGKCVSASAKDKCKKPPGCACAYGEGNL